MSRQMEEQKLNQNYSKDVEFTIELLMKYSLSICLKATLWLT